MEVKLTCYNGHHGTILWSSFKVLKTWYLPMGKYRSDETYSFPWLISLLEMIVVRESGVFATDISNSGRVKMNIADENILW